MDIITSYGSILVLFAGAVGFLMAWGIGANDVANAMGIIPNIVENALMVLMGAVRKIQPSHVHAVPNQATYHLRR